MLLCWIALQLVGAPPLRLARVRPALDDGTNVLVRRIEEEAMRAATLVIAVLCLGCATGATISRSPDPNRPSETELSSHKAAAPPAKGTDGRPRA